MRSWPNCARTASGPPVTGTGSVPWFPRSSRSSTATRPTTRQAERLVQKLRHNGDVMVRRIRRRGAGNDGHGHLERRAGHGQVPAGLRFHHPGQAPPRGVPMTGGGSGGDFGSRPPASQQSPVRTKEQAAAAAQAALSERDAIQANLLELAGSFGKRLLEGAALSGGTKRRWDVTAASL